jgi:hypothetical protein
VCVHMHLNLNTESKSGPGNRVGHLDQRIVDSLSGQTENTVAQLKPPQSHNHNLSPAPPLWPLFPSIALCQYSQTGKVWIYWA